MARTLSPLKSFSPSQYRHSVERTSFPTNQKLSRASLCEPRNQASLYTHPHLHHHQTVLARSPPSCNRSTIRVSGQSIARCVTRLAGRVYSSPASTPHSLLIFLSFFASYTTTRSGVCLSVSRGDSSTPTPKTPSDHTRERRVRREEEQQPSTGQGLDGPSAGNRPSATALRTHSRVLKAAAPRGPLPTAPGH